MGMAEDLARTFWFDWAEEMCDEAAAPVRTRATTKARMMVFIFLLLLRVLNSSLVVLVLKSIFDLGRFKNFLWTNQMSLQ
jgi:hypothetical protein